MMRMYLYQHLMTRAREANRPDLWNYIVNRYHRDRPHKFIKV